jgi:dihydrofolate reductase
MTVSVIAAMTKDGVIGKNNALPGWKIPGDMKRFKALTKGKVVIMGRKTYESIGKPLPDRFNIVVSSTLDYRQEGIWVVRSLEEALNQTSHLNLEKKEIMVIGGGNLYKQAIPFADRIYLTVLDETWEGDTYFPKLKRGEWVQVEREDHEKHSFFTFERVHTEPVKTYTLSEGTKQGKTMANDSYEELGRSVGALVDVKNRAYGSAFDDAGEFLKLLYPDGIQPGQYTDALALVRIFDKMKRIATDRDALGESPYRDIAGYGLLGLRRVEKSKESLQTAIRIMETRYGETPASGVDANGSPVIEG